MSRVLSGWTPSTFVSSRSDRAKKKTARPEDFMDEEDLAEMRENQKLVDEHEEMDFGGTAAEKRRQAGEGDDQECVCAQAIDMSRKLIAVSSPSLPFSPPRWCLHRKIRSVRRS